MQKMRTGEVERTLVEGVLDFLRILVHFRWLIIGLTGSAVALSIGFCILSVRLPPESSPLPNRYTARSVILVQEEANNDMGATLLAALGAADRSISEAAGFDTGSLVLLILRSRTVSDQLISELDLAAHYRVAENVRTKTRTALLRNEAFDYDRSTGAITVSFTDTDAALASTVVNRMVALAGQWFSENRGSAKRQQVSLLADKIAEVRDGIALLEDKLKGLQKKYGALTAQDLGTTQAAGLADLRSQLILKEIEIRNYSSFTLVDDQHLQQLNAERQSILDMIEQMQRSVPGTAAAANDAQSLPDVAQQFASLTLELDIQRRIYNTLSPQYEAAKLTTESAPVFQVLESAETPDMKSAPQRWRVVAVTALVSIVVAVLLSIFLGAVPRRGPSPRAAAEPR